jgi:hypothetical protein
MCEIGWVRTTFLRQTKIRALIMILGRQTLSHPFAQNAKEWGNLKVKKRVNQAFGT